MMWLLDSTVREAMQLAKANGVHPTAEQQLQFEARSFGSEDGPRLLTVAGSSAEIRVSGVITQTPDFFAYLFGGGNTTYPDIISAIAAAEQDDTVESITFKVDSPGGSIDGLFDTLATIQAIKKPTKSIVSNRAASAAFALVSQTDEIVAANRATSFGSIGVRVDVGIDPSVVTITSTGAPDKAPDASTEKGQKTIREGLLDPLHALFVESIADGRGTTVENVNANYGQGATMLADEAKKRGMIDSVAGSPLRVVTAPSPKGGGDSKGEKAMDLAQLKADHPAVYSAVLGIGQAEERDRVVGHLTMGASSGDMATAITAIKDGAVMTATLSATYLSAGMKRADVAARGADDADVDAALTTAAATTDEERDKGASDNLLAAALEICGCEGKV